MFSVHWNAEEIDLLQQLIVDTQAVPTGLLLSNVISARENLTLFSFLQLALPLFRNLWFPNWTSHMPPPKVALTRARRRQKTAARKRSLLCSGTEDYQDSIGLGEQWSYMGSCHWERLAQKPMHNPIFSKVRSSRKQIFSWTSLHFQQCGWEMVNRKITYLFSFPPFLQWVCSQ